MMSGDGYHEHDQLWVTKDGDNIDRSGIILMNEQYYAMIHLLLNKSLCLKLFFLIQNNLQMPSWSVPHVCIQGATCVYTLYHMGIQCSIWISSGTVALMVFATDFTPL
jgi:hypothetical protein